jgi:hypothetical protein
MNKDLVKWVTIFGGGLLAFSFFKPKKKELEAAVSNANNTETTQSFDDNESSVKPTKENAELVASAYTMAVQNNEPQSALNELNKECMKEYGMRCYMDKNNKVIVSDAAGNVILKK